MSTNRSKHSLPRTIAWVPRDPEFIKNWVGRKVKQANKRFTAGDQLHPVVKAWKTTIETDPQATMYFVQMFQELSAVGDEFLVKQGVTDYVTLMRVIDTIISEAPEFISNGTDIVGVPLLIILNFLMNTAAGQDAFLYDKINFHVKEVLSAWQDYLGMIDSANVINTTERGWISPVALKTFQDRDGKPFNQMYVCDQKLPHWGFGSWDHFFTRSLITNPRNPSDPATNARPLDADPTHVTSACESAVLRIAYDVQRDEEFWLKDTQPYSLVHMLAYDQNYIPRFVGGTVYQAFLSPFDYHRWHSPVTGTIEKITVLPGTYYAAIPGSADPNDPTKDVLVESQAFLSTVATRVIFYINSVAPDIGIVAFVAIGMAEVSTCHVTVRDGQSINKGDELGMFHFGGSTSCLIFNNNTELKFLNGIVDDQGKYVENKPVKINTGVAVAQNRSKRSGH